MSDTDKKPWFQSATIIGIFVAAAPTIAGIFGFNIDSATNLEIGDILTMGAEAIEDLITLGGSLLAIYGRIRATKGITAV